MSKLFIYIYDWFDNHIKSFYVILVLLIGVCVIMASQITFQENITNFFSSSEEKEAAIFENIRSKDRIIVMLSGSEQEDIIQAATIFERELDSLVNDGLLSSVITHADEEVIEQCSDFIYDYLPVFMTDSDFERLENNVTEESIAQTIRSTYDLLASPTGMFAGNILMQDPFGIATHLLQNFEQLSPDIQYEIYDGRLFTKDLSTMLMFVDPTSGMGDTGKNDELVSRLENIEKKAEINDVKIDCIGGPVVAVYNARQIKYDTTVTLGLAMIFILLVIFISFRNKWSIPFILIPPAFGFLFSLAMVWLIQGEISAIAIGTGTVVLGISLSYSIHIISHLNYISSPRKIIEELTIPLTIGCFTTICAFAALMFTSSALLQDMGLFSVFALIGTTLFSLIFLPQFLKKIDRVGKSNLLNLIERIVGYRFDDNKWVILFVLSIFVVALFFYRDVEFDDDMSNINYMPEHIIEAEKRSADIFAAGSNDVYIVTGAENLDVLINEYGELETLLHKSMKEGKIDKVVTLSDFVIPIDEQNKRIDRWNRFWKDNKDRILSAIAKNAQECGFKEGAFGRFEEIVNKKYTPCTYSNQEIAQVPLVSEWINSSGNVVSLLSRISITDAYKPDVYNDIDKLSNTMVIDRGYFSSKMVESTKNDFNYILLISSLIVFVALLISYGRIELTLLAFLPMAVSWVIILGLMAIFNIRFNIVNIILATFIFGIGDDFSIFIMDGLLQEYKSGKKMLGAHKIAIFFSAFTAIVGMGVLIFARHPALKSIALISVLGMGVVVFVSYSIQPMLFRNLITSQTERGEFPYTLGSILNTAYCFLYFLLGCILAQIYMLVLMVLPVKRNRKKIAFHKLLYGFTRFFLKTMVTVKTIRQNPYNETFEKPAMIIANHQSFIDILLLLSTTPKIVMLTNSWVWNSPFFGWIVKYADFQHSADGYEVLATRLRKYVAEGYSVVVFPEGTRSVDCSIQRFHKGAFYMAQLLKLDILPVIIYGAGQISAKSQGFYIKSGIIAVKTMKRITYGDGTFGLTYQEQAKNYRRWYIEQYRILGSEFGRIDNAYFREAIIKNYIYKGPVLEWYMRVKCRLDGYYGMWDRLVSRNAVITDMGCGYGQMALMLGLLSPDRQILGIDYDNEKIAVAQNSFLSKKCNIRFEWADMRNVNIPKSDAVLFNDSLHYVKADEQRQILGRAVASLKEGGIIIVRDGDAGQPRRHGKIEKTELWSTKILKFNKTSEELTFVTAEWMRNFAQDNQLDIRVHQCDKDSSETLYILAKNRQ